MPQPTCPTCSGPVDPQTSPALPFCSERCRQLDLGRWLNEAIGLPYAASEEEEEFGEFH